MFSKEGIDVAQFNSVPLVGQSQLMIRMSALLFKNKRDFIFRHFADS
jgi:hypothetical protein